MIPKALAALRRSLLTRVLVALLAALLLGIGVLFVSLDSFVSSHFHRLRAEQLDRSSDEVRRFVANEGRQLLNLALLLAQDADLNQSTFYHLFLAGEREHPLAAVERIAQTFALEAVGLWDAAGHPIAVVPAPTFAAAPELPPTAGSRLIEENGRAWLVADAPLLREGQPIAVLRIARPLGNALAAGLPALYPAALRVVEPGMSVEPPTERISLPPVTLALNLPDTANEALASAKRVFTVLLLGGGEVMAVFMVLYLRRQLRPLTTLADAAAAIGRGDFGHRVTAAGDTEVGRLAEAFNAMAADLAQLREMERRLAHQEQLSAIGRVAARVAHDINNPLTVIANTAQLALKSPPTDPQRVEDLHRIVHHGERCMRTLELLLDYARPVRIHAQRFDLAELAHSVGGRWQASVSNGTPVTVEADPLQIEQLLDNLLANARAAAGPGGKLSLAVGQAGREAQLVIDDSGPGFSAAARARLFEPFHTTKAGGTGLGLASALAIARAHGGDIEVPEMPAGAGARVIVRLPLTAQAREKVAAPR